MTDFEEEPTVYKEVADDEENSDVKEVKLFGRWTFDDVEIKDVSLMVRFFSILMRLSHLRIPFTNYCFQ